MTTLTIFENIVFTYTNEFSKLYYYTFQVTLITHQANMISYLSKYVLTKHYC